MEGVEKMTDSVPSDLEKQIAEARRTISTDGYPMSIGELTNMYREGELIIRPEFQRFFRWKAPQKSRLIESLLLSIPLPSIFVAQTENGVWEVVDGLQRISTIMELQGELRDPLGTKLPPLVLQSTKYLKALEGKMWEGSSPTDTLSEAQKLDVKRAKLDVKIVKRESSKLAKFDLFQRLNSYGSTLNAQELRSALLVAASGDFFAWLEELSRDANFRTSVALSDTMIEERYDLELVTRFLVLHNWEESALTLTALRDLPQLLDDKMIALAEQFPAFEVIANNGGEDVFRRWDLERLAFKGAFLNTSFEVFGLGIGFQIANGQRYRTDLIPLAKHFWSQMESGFATGKSTESRLIKYIPVGRAFTRG
jgi:hypothetical protein